MIVFLEESLCAPAVIVVPQVRFLDVLEGSDSWIPHVVQSNPNSHNIIRDQVKVSTEKLSFG